MLDSIQLDNILFLDIETVPETEHFSDLDSDFQELFAHKTQYQRKEDVSPEEFYERAGIWAEFGKIICISVGYFTQKKGERQFRVTTFQGDEERILLDYSNLLNNHFNLPQHVMCGHNVKEFDFPYIARRMLIHGIKLTCIVVKLRHTLILLIMVQRFILRVTMVQKNHFYLIFIWQHTKSSWATILI